MNVGIIIALTVINILIALLNVGVLGLAIKLYTEYFKDRKIDWRAFVKSNPPPPDHPNCSGKPKSYGVKEAA